MYCKKCGNAMEEDESFCKKCGTPVIANEDVAQKDMGEVQQNKKISVGLIVLISALGILVIGIGIVIALMINPADATHDQEAIEVATVVPGTDAEEEEEKEQEVQNEPQEEDTLASKMVQSEEEFKASCKYYTYEQLARNPKEYIGLPVILYGEVIQVMEEGEQVALRVNITEGEVNWQNAVYVDYTRQLPNESRILEGDIITFWGISNDTISYEAVLGNSITVPYIKAVYIALGIDEQFWPTPEVVVEPEVMIEPRDYGWQWYGDYIIPYSDVYYLSEEDLRYLSKEELCLARNEIYARHGRMFHTDYIQSYFNTKPWYYPIIEPEAFSESMLNEIEAYNANFIKEYEDQFN